MKFLKISDIKLNMDESHDKAFAVAKKTVGVRDEDVLDEKIIRMSIDSRKKDNIRKIYTVGLKVKQYSKKRKNVLVCDNEPKYKFKCTGTHKLNHRPVIVGFGPAGMFCGYMLALAGYRPIIIERGSNVEKRREKVVSFWGGGKLDTECNVQFGEGGAGTFSDGKLNTGIKDKQNRIAFVLETFVKFGAPENILYEAKPHIGTDYLWKVVRNIREYIIQKGGTILFDRALMSIEESDGRLKKIILSDGSSIDTDICVLAIGHSARDTFEMLYQNGVTMEQKPFAVGVRVEHKQSFINKSQYGFLDDRLGAATYKLTYKTSNNRGVYSFCMCPGGYVVNASSEENHLTVNGMSYNDRQGYNANSAIVVTVSPKDFSRKSTYSDDADSSADSLSHDDFTLSDDPLAGIEFQRLLEHKAYEKGKGKIPIQKFSDFKEHKISCEFGDIVPQTKGETSFADINEILPDYICDAIKEGIEHFGKIIPGFDADDVVLSAVESRTSSPVRILRDESLQTNIAGIFPAGEGAGYAGGITSAAIDGMKIFEYIATNYCGITGD